MGTIIVFICTFLLADNGDDNDADATAAVDDCGKDYDDDDERRRRIWLSTVLCVSPSYMLGFSVNPCLYDDDDDNDDDERRRRRI